MDITTIKTFVRHKAHACLSLFCDEEAPACGEKDQDIRRISVTLPSPLAVAVVLGLSIIFWAGTAISQDGSMTAPPQNNAGSNANLFQGGAGAGIPWRIRILDAATVTGPNVTLGEIAEPVGPMPPETWQSLAGRELWPAPTVSGRPINVPRPKLKDQIRRDLGPELEELCIFPASLVIQRGGRVLREAELQQILVKTLTSRLAALPGEAHLNDIRLPPYIFLSNSAQTVSIEPVNELLPGRLPLRISVLELDKSVTRRISASAFLDLWATVPAAREPMNRGDDLTPDKITFVRKNLAYVRGEVWDGVGGPHRLKRAVGAEQIIYTADLDEVPLIVKGARVVLIYARGTVRLEVPAEAAADGAAGKMLAVRNLQSQRIVKALVQDSRTVLAN